MKEYQEVWVPGRTGLKVVRVICDLCKEVAPEPIRGDVAETKVALRTGTSYPEGGSGEATEFDICPDCFEKQLMPWLKSQGATPYVSGWDF